MKMYKIFELMQTFVINLKFFQSRIESESYYAPAFIINHYYGKYFIII